MDFLKGFRVLAPVYCRHVTFLCRYYKPSPEEVKKFLDMANVAKLRKSIPDMEKAFKYLIGLMIKKAGINLVVENVPDYGTRKSDNLPDRITARVFHDTMEQFGEVRDAVVFAKHAYVWFYEQKDAVHTQKLINNMMIEKNIIKATAVCM